MGTITTGRKAALIGLAALALLFLQDPIFEYFEPRIGTVFAGPLVGALLTLLGLLNMQCGYTAHRQKQEAVVVAASIAIGLTCIIFSIRHFLVALLPS